MTIVGNVAAVICVLLILVAIFGPLLAPDDPTAPDVLHPLASSSSSHLLGTDETGRDILSRLLYGARSSIAGPALVVALTAFFGTVLAIAAAWRGGWFDGVVSRLLDILFSFPGLLLAIIVVTMFGAGFVAPVIALAIAYTPTVARVLRSAALRERHLPYIEALEIEGASGWSICARHVFPSLLPLLLVQCAVGFGYAMIDLAAISFLGLGIQPPGSNWGLMVAEGQPAILEGKPEQALFAALVVVIAVVSFNLLGERIARHFEREAR
jgi:peptide/nickel transport system permease protein